jgi:hypothetical protein
MDFINEVQLATFTMDDMFHDSDCATGILYTAHELPRK